MLKKNDEANRSGVFPEPACFIALCLLEIFIYLHSAKHHIHLDEQA